MVQKKWAEYFVQEQYEEAGYDVIHTGVPDLILLKDGKIVMQIDALQRNVEKSVPKAVQFLESVGAGTVGAVGASLLVPGLGLAMLPGVIIFGSVYHLAKIMRKK